MNSASVLIKCSVSTSMNHRIWLINHSITLWVNFCFKNFINFSVVNVFNIGVGLRPICIPVFNLSWSLQKTVSVFFEEIFFTEAFSFH